MPITILIHVMNEETVVAEVEKLPEPVDQFLICENPHLRDGRDVSYVMPEVKTLIYPWHRIQCIEVMPGAEEEKIISFVRE